MRATLNMTKKAATQSKDPTVVVPCKGYYTTGLYPDVVQVGFGEMPKYSNLINVAYCIPTVVGLTHSISSIT